MPINWDYTMRALIFTFCFSLSLTGAALSDDQNSWKYLDKPESLVIMSPKGGDFDVLGPKGPYCIGPECPTEADLDAIAKRGTQLMKISGGRITPTRRVYIQPHRLESKPQIDDLRTGPSNQLPVMDMSVGVQTELMDDLIPEFEPEFASNTSDPLTRGAFDAEALDMELLEALSASNLEALSNSIDTTPLRMTR